MCGGRRFASAWSSQSRTAATLVSQLSVPGQSGSRPTSDRDRRSTSSGPPESPSQVSCPRRFGRQQSESLSWPGRMPDRWTARGQRVSRTRPTRLTPFVARGSSPKPTIARARRGRGTRRRAEAVRRRSPEDRSPARRRRRRRVVLRRSRDGRRRRTPAIDSVDAVREDGDAPAPEGRRTGNGRPSSTTVGVMSVPEQRPADPSSLKTPTATTAGNGAREPPL